MIGKSNKQVLNIYIKRNLQITKNSQTKCVKDEQFRSSLVFDTISLKQIFALTQSVVFWDSRTFASQDKMIYSMKKKDTRSCFANYSMSLSLSDTKWNAQNILTGRVFWKVVFMNERLWKIIRYWTDTLF